MEHYVEVVLDVDLSLERHTRCSQSVVDPLTEAPYQLILHFQLMQEGLLFLLGLNEFHFLLNRYLFQAAYFLLALYQLLLVYCRHSFFFVVAALQSFELVFPVILLVELRLALAQDFVGVSELLLQVFALLLADFEDDKIN